MINTLLLVATLGPVFRQKRPLPFCLKATYHKEHKEHKGDKAMQNLVLFVDFVSLVVKFPSTIKQSPFWGHGF